MPNNFNPINNPSSENLEIAYQEFLKKVRPYVEDAASQVRNRDINEDMINSMVEDILRRSGLSEYIDDTYDLDDSDEVIPVQGFIGYNNPFRWNNRQRFPNQNYGRRRRYPSNVRYPRYPIYPRYPGFYPQDLVRLLLLQQLGGYNPYY